MLEYVAVCCVALQRVAVWCGELMRRCPISAPATSNVSIMSDRAIMCCSVLQCVAVCCSVLQRVAVCCSASQCVAALSRGVGKSDIRLHYQQHSDHVCKAVERHDTLQHTIQHTLHHTLQHTLQHTAKHGDTLQHAAAHCNTPQQPRHTASHCNTVHCTALHCTALQQVATQCNALQHT